MAPNNGIILSPLNLSFIMIMEDWEILIEFMDINLDPSEVQHTFRFSKQELTYTLLDLLIFVIEKENGIKELRVFLKVF